MNIKKVMLSMLFISVVCSNVSYPMSLPTVGKQVAHTWTQWLLDRPMTINPYGIYDWCSNHAFLTTGITACSLLSIFFSCLKYKQYCKNYAENIQNLKKNLEKAVLMNKDEFKRNLNEEIKLQAQKINIHSIREKIDEFCFKKDSVYTQSVELKALIDEIERIALSESWLSNFF
ncbi:MAG: hypothetical protein WDZ41_03410 [Candidatus Babeliales bacterium]